MNWLFLGAFGALLFASVGLGFSLIWALLGGYGLFFLYGLLQGHRPGALWRMSLKGVRTVGNILFLFLLIGAITALWRGAGTIPFLIYYASGLIAPALFPLLSFLLCSLLSFLTGTSFGTAATMGTICMTMGTAMGLSPILTAGAILSGSFWGDRCSPMSTSALLVAALTETDLYQNIKGMVKTCLVPMVLSCLLYLVTGLGSHNGTFSRDLLDPFAQGFTLHWVTVLPAAVVVILSLLKRSVRLTMGLSILTSALLCLLVQGMGPWELVKTALLGYTPHLPELAGLVSGGGVISMVSPFCIVCISATYSGLFEGTGLLKGLRAPMAKLARRVTPFGALTVAAAGTSLISCNQTLAILLSHSLCKEDWDKEKLAIALENTAVVLAPLVPWSIAGAVPLATIGAPVAALGAAWYLYLIPLWNWGVAVWKKR